MSIAGKEETINKNTDDNGIACNGCTSWSYYNINKISPSIPSHRNHTFLKVICLPNSHWYLLPFYDKMHTEILGWVCYPLFILNNLLFPPCLLPSFNLLHIHIWLLVAYVYRFSFYDENGFAIPIVYEPMDILMLKDFVKFFLFH